MFSFLPSDFSPFWVALWLFINTSLIYDHKHLGSRALPDLSLFPVQHQDLDVQIFVWINESFPNAYFVLLSLFPTLWLYQD